MKISVTTSHIMAGDKENSRFCPVAIAVRDITHRPCEVTTSEIRTRIGTAQVEAVLPRVVRRWIQEFDSGHAVAPIEFEVHFR